MIIDIENTVLHKEIRKWEHLTIKKLNKFGYFYSDVSDILIVSLPEDVCKVIKEDYNLDVNYISFDGKYAIFDKRYKNYHEMGYKFNGHFNTNATFNQN